ncbi:acyl carrier protein [Klebsiella sp. RHBSTW-00484]|uniref:acyl carrier protein n=1 Tax=unclassified Klebsiella TaxID=2608929 RepID=UPI0015E49A95|nr:MULTISPECIES: phosphopantetheine-binding protein [unclassified Klebsiella]MBA7845707.1 acyl carrier protein [Klebsiella sp. RHBSTW-00465]QLO38351.1 acyl carrier protein [Klebsiella sp. RHBSTW-00484]QLT77871.1 acyl carrier protein [Klebsiella sp. RHBSTW-00464]
MTDINEKIDERKSILFTIKTEIIQRLNVQREIHQIDDDTPLFGNGLKLDSVDATEIIVMLDKTFNVQASEGDDPAYMRSINSLASFIIQKKSS